MTDKKFAPAKVTKGRFGTKIGVKVDDFVVFLNENKKESGWINLELKESLKGVQYIELDTWTPTQSISSTPPNKEEGDLPF